MKNSTFRQSRPVDKIRTTIGVRLATKNFILNRSLPGESLEDTILRIVHDWERMEERISSLELILKNNGIREPNLLASAKTIRRNDGVLTSDGGYIDFSYNFPEKLPVGIQDYSMEIVVERVLKGGKEYTFDELPLEEKDRMYLHFKMVEKVINLHFDGGFKLSERRSLIDPRYWKKVFSRVGLPDSSYMNDILKVIQHYESGGQIDR